MKIDRIYKIENACSTDQLRPAMRMIRLQKRKMVATNGHILAVVPYKREDGDTATKLSPEIVRSARKLTKKRDDIELKNVNASASLLNGTTMPNTLGDPDGEDGYPNYGRILHHASRDKKIHRVSFNVQLLKDLADAMGAETVMLELPENNTHAIVVLPNSRNASDKNDSYGILMPVSIGPVRESD